jgi:hypothetical protein
MTKLLEKAIAQASKLPNKEQDVLASLMLEELASEQRWDQAFAKSQDKLAGMAKNARSQFRAGKTRPMGKI